MAPIIRSIGLVTVWIVLPLVLLNNTVVPFAWIGILWLGACLYLMWSANRGGRKAFWFNLGFFFALVAVAECWLSLHNGQQHAGLKVTGSYTDGDYFVEHPLLGYAPPAGIQVTAREHDGERLIYTVTYRIGPDGLRMVPRADDNEPTDGSVLFFGGSFTFGEGLPDEQTLPYLAVQGFQQSYVSYNLGFHGYGPHQMLAALEHGLVDSVVKQAPRHVIYQAIPDHVARVAGLSNWDRHGPKYVLNDKGELVGRGHFDDGSSPLLTKVVDRLRKSRIFARCYDLANHVRPRDVDLMVAIVDETQRLIDTRYPDCTFDVILWDDADNWLTTRIRSGLVDRGIRVHSIRDILLDISHDRSPYRLSQHDSHPNGRANRRIAGYLRDRVLR
ncbi:MAG: hypothetical protein ACC645_00990 [Pirellulales bacterium]